MTALGCYMSACRFAIGCERADAGSASDLGEHLTALRKALSCCVCEQIVAKPRSWLPADCRHNICEACVGGEMKLQIPCACAKNQDSFADNAQVRILVQCFKKLCEFILASAVINCGSNSLQTLLHEGSSISDVCCPVTMSDSGVDVSAHPQSTVTPGRLVKRGRKRRKRRFSTKIKPSSWSAAGSGDCLKDGDVSRQIDNADEREVEVAVLSDPVREQLPSTQEEVDVDVEGKVDAGITASMGVLTFLPSALSGECIESHHIVLTGDTELTHESFNAVTAEHDYTSREPYEKDTTDSYMEENSLKLLPNSNVIKNETHSNIVKYSKGKVSLIPEITSKFGKEKTETGPEQHSKPKPAKIQRKGSGCRCGLATTNPGKLTCCGQRCPCYSAFRGCVDCRCRGCRNPRGDPTKLSTMIQPLVQLQEKDNMESDIEIDI